MPEILAWMYHNLWADEDRQYGMMLQARASSLVNALNTVHQHMYTEECIQLICWHSDMC